MKSLDTTHLSTTAAGDTTVGLKQVILDEGAKHDGRIPSERDLAKQLGVSRIQIRKVMAQLEAEQLIWRHVGRGTFMGPREEATDAQQFFGDALNDPKSVIELREGVEPTVARLAAMRATTQDVRRMRAFLKASYETREADVFNRCCEKLHEAMALATHNKLIAKLYTSLNPVRALGQAVGEHVPMNEEEHTFFFLQHQAVVDAIADHDPDRAEFLMRSHIASVGEDALLGAANMDASGTDFALEVHIGMLRPALRECALLLRETCFLSTQDKENEVVMLAVETPPHPGHVTLHPGDGLRPSDCSSSRLLRTMNDASGAAVPDHLSSEDSQTGALTISVPIQLGDFRFALTMIGSKGLLRRREMADIVRIMRRTVTMTKAATDAS